MGVQGLWELLAPVGRRVSVETLAGKKLAIDASIWMVQFMKAMRDEKGEMVRNAHILGFFRRICKLLFLRTRPVFVFDGGTPILKRRTIAARRRHRENARAKIRKTAEKLLLNHLKAKKLEELAEEIKNSSAKDDSKGKRVMSADENDLCGTSIPKGADENMPGAISQEGLDEMLAASLAAEEGKFADDEPASSGKFPSEAEFEDDGNEEIPVIDGNVDPTVLASLPPSMQLDLLVQMREKLIAENRQKYQKIKKSPSKFSELQIQSYLKTVAFRREIDEVQKFAAGRGPEGVQTSRIASEANREFIFSSSFTGDKRVFTSAGVEKNADAGKTELPIGKVSTLVDSLKDHSLPSQQTSTGQVNVDETTKDFGHDIETYHDERGRLRVSRVRGLGIRMTRDLQWNLHLIKEYEVENIVGNVNISMEPTCSKKPPNVSHSYSKHDSPGADRKDNEEPSQDLDKSEETSVQKIKKDHRYEPSMVENGSTIEVSFSVDDIVDRDNDLFSQLVAGSSTSQPLKVCSLDESSNHCESNFDWEDGIIENESEVTDNKAYNDTISQASFEERVTSENDGLNWEEGDVETASANQIEHVKPVSRGSLEEEFEIQEAIRRSLEDLGEQSDARSLLQAQTPTKSTIHSSPMSQQCDTQQRPTQHATVVDEFEVLDTASHGSCLQTIDSVEEHCFFTTSVHPDSKLSKIDEPNGSSQTSSHAFFTQSSTDVWIAEKAQIDEVPATVLSQMQISERESFLDTSIRNVDKTSLGMSADVSTPGSSDLCVVVEGKAECDADRARRSILLDSYKIPEEKDYMYDPPNQSWGDCTETLESTLDEELLHLGREYRDLVDEQRKLERNAESVNSEMFAECQELLQMFGLPFIIAPMEAEAQCAYMELMNLVDGVVTDDSDVFLFGAQNVYKNIFDDRKYVETYLMKDIEKELGLTREMLIRMALLLGSDYTEGVSGIGIVNAIEVVHAFPEEDGLKKFREWVESPDPAILGKLYPHIGDSNKKRLSKASNNNGDGGDANDPLSDRTQENVQSSNGILDVTRTFMDKHRNVSKNWHIPSSFPSESVVSAYINPQVDESTEPFTWGKPDLPLLRKLCWEKFGWANQKADDLLVPVLKEYNKHETQLRLEAFYTFNEKFAKIRSRRIKRAVKGITGNSSSGLMGDLEGGNAGVKKNTRRISEVEENRCENHSDGKHDGRKGLRQSEEKSQKPLADKRCAEAHAQGESVVKEMSESNVCGERGRVRRGGRKRKGGAGRGKKEIDEHSFETTETTSSDCSYHSIGTENQVEKECSSGLRRSVRQRKHVQYAEENMGDDSLYDFPENRREICLDTPPAAHCGGSSTGGDNVDRSMGIIGERGGSGVSKSATDRGHLLSGSGFCTDDSGLNCNSTEPISSTEECPMGKGTRDGDYLLNGGGFCVDDGNCDLSGNPTQPMSSAELSCSGSLTKTTDAPGTQDMDMKKCSFDGNPVEETKVRHQETGILTEQEAGRGHQTGYGFTAMTSLRRKRR